jgi:hypothetical protein
VSKIHEHYAIEVRKIERMLSENMSAPLDSHLFIVASVKFHFKNI